MVEFEVGNVVERDIDGLWFPAVITHVSADQMYSLVYIEDGNQEDEVHTSEIRSRVEGDAGFQNEIRALKEQGLISTTDGTTVEMKKETSDNTKKQQETEPIVTVHDRNSAIDGSSYVINGLENNVATGTGIRGIRWIRSSVTPFSSDD